MAETLSTAWLPDYVFTGGCLESGLVLVAGSDGRIKRLSRDAADLESATRLPARVMLPGLVNAHSHTFQRVIRGRTEHRTGPQRDTFWTWREKMFHAAITLAPGDIYDAARMAFLEMALSGITTVGEFHYLHHAPDGVPYDDPNETAKQVVRAARDTGIRIALLHCAYARAGWRKEPTPAQIRFSTPSPDSFLSALGRLGSDLAATYPSDLAWTGIAPHSVRAVSLEYLRVLRDAAVAAVGPMPVHMHVSEQPAENEACFAEHGLSPVALLEREGLLNPNFTAVHAIHMTASEIARFARANARVCACPTTERNLGDGILRADLFLGRNVPVSLGTDTNIQIDLLEDAREIEYHLRLHQLEREVLAPHAHGESGGDPSALARLLFTAATQSGADALHAAAGSLETGRAADFFTVDLNDPGIAGAHDDSLLTNIVFCAGRAAIRDVVVGGVPVIADGCHAEQGAVVERFTQLQKRLWK